MQSYYYLPQLLQGSPYELSLLDALHLGATEALPLYAQLPDLVILENISTGELEVVGDLYLQVSRELVSVMERDAVRAAVHPVSERVTKLTTAYPLEVGTLDNRSNRYSHRTLPFSLQPNEAVDVFVDMDLENGGKDRLRPTEATHPKIDIADLLCWTDDLEMLADKGRIKCRTYDTSTAASSQPESDRELTVLRRTQRTLAALAMGLAKNHRAYNNNGKPNASQLAKLATEHLRDATSDRTPHGFSETTARQTIAEALKACPDLTQT